MILNFFSIKSLTKTIEMNNFWDVCGHFDQWMQHSYFQTKYFKPIVDSVWICDLKFCEESSCWEISNFWLAKFQGFMQFGYMKLGSTFQALLMTLHFSDLQEIVSNYLLIFFSFFICNSRVHKFAIRIS